MPLYLCLDQGGHASRALVLDEGGQTIARAVREVATRMPAENIAEQDPDTVAASLLDCAHAALSALGPRATEVVAAGLATQRSSIVCWDRISGRALAPVISWQDRRAHAWLMRFSSQADAIEQRTGLRLSAHYGASKLRWCLEQLEPVRSAQRRGTLAFGPLASFLAFRLLAERPLVADSANAQRTLLWNLAQRNWDSWLLELFGIPAEALPVCSPTLHDFGHLQVQQWTLPLTILTGDQSAALFAGGLPHPDCAFINMGTGAFVQRAQFQPRRAQGLVTGIALDAAESPVYTLEGTVNGAGAALSWAAQTFALPDLELRLDEWLVRDAEVPLFLNGVGGLGAPYWIADFASRFIGEGESWQKAVAVAESTVFLVIANLERMRAAGVPLRSLVLSGGLAGHDGVCQRLADLTGLVVIRPAEREATARGLAWLLAGRSSNWPAAGADRFTPKHDPAIEDRYRRWHTALAQALG